MGQIVWIEGFTETIDMPTLHQQAKDTGKLTIKEGDVFEEVVRSILDAGFMIINVKNGDCIEKESPPPHGFKINPNLDITYDKES